MFDILARVGLFVVVPALTAWVLAGWLAGPEDEAELLPWTQE